MHKYTNIIRIIQVLLRVYGFLRKLYLGENSSIVIKNSANIIANNVIFDKSGTAPWQGIYLENAGTFTSIDGCVFNNVKNPIRIINNEQSAYYNKIIKNSTFNLHQDGGNAIYAENVFSLLIDNNNFNIPAPYNSLTTGLYIKNYYNAGPPHDGFDGYNLNILNNTFSGSQYSMLLFSYASKLTPYFVYNNTFYPSGNCNIIGRMMTGNIKSNNFTASSTNKDILLWQGSPNLLYNAMNSGDVTLLLSQNSAPSLAPYILPNGYIVWTGGQNTLSSQNNDNIHIQTGGGYVYTDLGNNHFTTTINNYHLFGNLDTYENIYKTWNNCWYYPGTNNAVGYLWNNNNQPITIDDYKTPGFICPKVILPETDMIITNKGYGIFDTTIVTSGYLVPPIPEDDRKYYLALQKKDAEFYFDAVFNYKLYIDSYPESQFIHTSLYELYECHEMLDTCDDQDYRDILYGDLRMYLDGRIQSGLYDAEFVDIAYNLILMCEANMYNLDISLEGFEFIALFHPDPEARLLASWDFDAIQNLLDSGSSGGITEKIIAKDKQRRIKKFEKLIDNDPLMKKVHDTYKVKEIERDQKTEKNIINRSSDERTANERIIRSKERDMKIKSRASTNLTYLRYLSKEEKEKRLLEDITLLTGNVFENNDNSKLNKIIPVEYSLSQNYPNPFNPLTTISYDLPKDGNVKLIVYDMLGREVSKLVNNEFKSAGRHSVVFDGSSLSSGIYFYRIEVNNGKDFRQVKRMMLIK